MNTRNLFAALALGAALTSAACGNSGKNVAEVPGGDPFMTCEAGNTECTSDTPDTEGDQMPAGDPFMTCEAGNTECTSDTDTPAEGPAGPDDGAAS